MSKVHFTLSQIVLNFRKKISKRGIKNKLYRARITSFKETDHEYIIFNNYILTGLYVINLIFSPDSSSNWNKLSQYKDFKINIYDGDKVILETDYRFKDQYWVSKNTFGQLTINHLVDIINHCIKLDALKAFN